MKTTIDHVIEEKIEVLQKQCQRVINDISVANIDAFIATIDYAGDKMREASRSLKVYRGVQRGHQSRRTPVKVSIRTQ